MLRIAPAAAAASKYVRSMCCGRCAVLPIAIVAYADDCCGCRLCAQECPTDCIMVDDTRDTESMSMYDKLGLVDRWDA